MKKITEDKSKSFRTNFEEHPDRGFGEAKNTLPHPPQDTFDDIVEQLYCRITHWVKG